MRGLTVATALAVALLVGCSGAPDASVSGGSPSPSPSASALVTPSASVAPSPIGIPSARPSQVASVQPPTGAPPTEQPPTPSAQTGPRWELLAESPTGLPVFDREEVTPNVLGFEAGYVSYAIYGLDIWFSEDGVYWEHISLPPSEPPSEPRCEDDYSDGIVKGATNGQSAILLSEYTTGENCDLQSHAWLTEDGRTWRRSGPIGDSHGITEADSVDIWAVPGGWEAAIGTDEDATAILQSVDGVNWTQATSVPTFGSVDGAADASGNRLLSVRLGSIAPYVQEGLITSVDGLTWNDLEARFNRSGDMAVVWAMEPPTGGSSAWILLVDEYDEDVSYPDDPYRGQTLWRSDDLRQWEPVSPPAASTSLRTATSEGLIATACNRRGKKCATYVTRDRREWAPVVGLPADGGLQWVTEGPAGVLAGTDEGSVYRLVP
jgi:hypothetical protein